MNIFIKNHIKLNFVNKNRKLNYQYINFGNIILIKENKNIFNLTKYYISENKNNVINNPINITLRDESNKLNENKEFSLNIQNKYNVNFKEFYDKMKNNVEILRSANDQIKNENLNST